MTRSAARPARSCKRAAIGERGDPSRADVAELRGDFKASGARSVPQVRPVRHAKLVRHNGRVLRIDGIRIWTFHLSQEIGWAGVRTGRKATQYLRSARGVKALDAYALVSLSRDFRGRKWGFKS